MKPTRVFISYAWENDDYRIWVRSLAVQLRTDGFDVRLDQWHLERGVTIPEFMNREVRLADIVLILCSPMYRSKVHRMEERVRTSGAGWEAMLIGAQLFAAGQCKLELALARGEWTEAAPDFLLGFPFHHIGRVLPWDLEAYRGLCESLRGERPTAPPVSTEGRQQRTTFDLAVDSDALERFYYDNDATTGDD
jgi:hypothetical protein